jgi:prepilin-type N-terminal cleavage/methylation domain-containing protein
VVYYRAFSLIELIVVIAIIGLLSTIAMPFYSAYNSRTKIADAYRISGLIAMELIKSYETTGKWPSSISWGGRTYVTSYPGVLQATPELNKYGIATMRVEAYAPSNQVRVLTSTIGLTGIPGYVGDTGAVGGAANTSNLLGLVATMGTSLVFKCGTDTPVTTYYIPMNFQPSTCTCTVLNTYFGTPSTAC